MKSLRNLVGLILALALAAFGAPALAQTKIYSLTLPTSSVAPGQTAEIIATFKNETPNGNSSFNSIQGLKVTGPLSIVGVSVPNGGVQPSPIPAAGVKSINITSMSPVKNGQTFKVTLTVKADAAPGCTNSSATWTVDNVWTGSALSGNTFARVPAGGSWPTTTVTGGACSLSFAPGPADALTNQSITSTPFSNIGPSVKVKAVNGSNAPVSGVPVRLEKSGGTCTIANTSYVTTGADGLATFSGLASSTAGGCTLTATTTAAGVATAAAQFNVVEGVLKITGLSETVVSPVSVTVSLVNTSTAGVIPAAGTAGLVGSCATIGQTAAPAGTVTFANLTFPEGVCTIGATGQFAGVTINSNPAESSQKVASVTANGNIVCDGTTLPGFSTTFDASAAGANDPTDTAFAQGFRGVNGKAGTCVPAPYIATNNISSASGAFDANGFKLPTNAFSIVYDVPSGNDVVMAYVLTFKAEVAPNGLPNLVGRAKYCKAGTTGVPAVDKDCTLTANQKLLQGCVSPTVALASLPGTEPACLAGLSWSTVAPTECAVALTAPDACIKVSIRVIDGRDPPIMWGDN